MKQLLTKSEWDEITNTYQNGLGEEIQSGDLSHIEDHMKIATMLNYFPSLRSGIVRKDAEDSWTVTMGGETMQVSNEDIQGLFDEMLITPYRFLVIPDNYTTPENADIGASIGIYGGPSATVQEIGNIANTVTGLMNTIREMQSRIEALENPA